MEPFRVISTVAAAADAYGRLAVALRSERPMPHTLRMDVAPGGRLAAGSLEAADAVFFRVHAPFELRPLVSDGVRVGGGQAVARNVGDEVVMAHEGIGVEGGDDGGIVLAHGNLSLRTRLVTPLTLPIPPSGLAREISPSPPYGRQPVMSCVRSAM